MRDFFKIFWKNVLWYFRSRKASFICIIKAGWWIFQWILFFLSFTFRAKWKQFINNFPVTSLYKIKLLYQSRIWKENLSSNSYNLRMRMEDFLIDFDLVRLKRLLEGLVSARIFHKSNFPALISNLLKSAGNFDL